MNDSSSRVCRCGGGPEVCAGIVYSNSEYASRVDRPLVFIVMPSPIARPAGVGNGGQFAGERGGGGDGGGGPAFEAGGQDRLDRGGVAVGEDGPAERGAVRRDHAADL